SDGNCLAEGRRDNIRSRPGTYEEMTLSPKEHIHPVLTRAAVRIIDRVRPSWQRTHAGIAHAYHPAAASSDLLDGQVVGGDIGIAYIAHVIVAFAHVQSDEPGAFRHTELMQ